MSARASCTRLIARGGWSEDALLQRCRVPIGPRNTWSNAAYALAGGAVYAAAPSPETGVVMGMSVILAFGSGLYHAHKSTYFNDLDHAGMYAVFGALAVYGWWANATAMMGVAMLGAWVGAFVRHRASLDTQVGVLLAIAMAGIAWRDWREALVILGVYGIGYVVQRLDHAHSPLVRLWGHALWHVLTAIAIALTGLAITAHHLGGI